MALSNLHKNYTSSYKDDLYALVKTKENSKLLGSKDLSLPNDLNAHVSGNLIDLGYGYDVFQNSGTLKSDLKNLASSTRTNLSDEQAIQAVQDLIDSHKVWIDKNKTWQFQAGGGIDTPKALQEQINSYITLSSEKNAETLMANELNKMQTQIIAKTGLSESNELLALVDMAFNGGMGLIGPNLKNAIANDNRVAAWYEIRYGSNAGKDGSLQGRRNKESDLFGLYSSEVPTTKEEADYVIQYLESRRPTISDYLGKIKNYNGSQDLNKVLAPAEKFLGGEIYVCFTANKFQIVADYFGMTLEEVRNDNPNLFISENKSYVLIEKYTTLSVNGIEMTVLSDGTMRVDDNLDHYIIRGTVVEPTSEDMAFSIQLKDALDNSRTDLAKLQFSNLHVASNDENSTWMTYLRAKQVSSVESSIFALETALNSTDVSITEDASGKFSTIKANGNTFVITDHGQIIQYDASSSKVFVVTGQYTESSYTIASTSPLSDELLGSIAEALSTSSTVTLPEGFNGSIVLSSSDNQITLSSITDSSGNAIGTATKVQEGNVETTTQSYNDASLPTLTIVKTTGFVANYSNGAFQGFSSIDGVAVSDGFNELFFTCKPFSTQKA